MRKGPTEVIGFVRLFVSTKIARSEHSGITVVGKCDQIASQNQQKTTFLLVLNVRHLPQAVQSCDYIGHAYRPYLEIPYRSISRLIKRGVHVKNLSGPVDIRHTT